ncbi:hypothetical protein [Bacillus dakarensis]|uniref:hypothetical protein n=1 Tax=Robertmurraya dakarensis TaxID=1926278 RepID=UPI001115A8BF|nr:hypothetical protein [Bacillus dakarensis]
MMDKAIVVGVYEFLAFHFCKKFLDDGMEVIGVHSLSQENDLFTEEKRMEIGRNANFVEEKYEKWTVTDEQEEVLLVLDYYDLFIRNVEKELDWESMKLKLSGLKNGKGKVLFLMPIQLLMQGRYEQHQSQMKEILSSFKRDGIAFNVYYLPTVYGPWQYIESAFQQYFLMENDHFMIHEREWTGDALHVEDVIDSILSFLSDKYKAYLLESSEADKWTKCARVLDILPDAKQERETLLSFDGEKIAVHDSKPYQMRLAHQKRHAQVIKVILKSE